MDKRQAQLERATTVANRHGDLHPWAVAIMACNMAKKADYDAFIVGLLHDSIEDEYFVEDELVTDFDDVVARAVMILTRRDGERYADYVARIKAADGQEGRLARKVKLADATVNLERCVNEFGYSSLEERYRMVIKELS